MSSDVDEAIRHNTAEFMEKGPGLRYDSYRTYVVARCPSGGTILLGGLGVMGVGEMWFTESEEHKSHPGYAEAEIVASEVSPEGIRAWDQRLREGGGVDPWGPHETSIAMAVVRRINGLGADPTDDYGERAMAVVIAALEP